MSGKVLLEKSGILKQHAQHLSVVLLVETRTQLVLMLLNRLPVDQWLVGIQVSNASTPTPRNFWDVKPPVVLPWWRPRIEFRQFFTFEPYYVRSRTPEYV
jgi:hypothetical protein